MADETPDVPPSKQEMAALELYHQLVNLSPDNGDIALRLTLRLPNGAYVGDVLLSAEDVEHLADGAMALADHRNHFSEQAADPLPLDEDDITDAAVEGLAADFAKFLSSEDGER